MIDNNGSNDPASTESKLNAALSETPRDCPSQECDSVTEQGAMPPDREVARQSTLQWGMQPGSCLLGLTAVPKEQRPGGLSRKG